MKRHHINTKTGSIMSPVINGCCGATTSPRLPVQHRLLGLPLPSSGVGYPPSCGSRSAPFSSPACMIWVRCGHQPATKAAPSAHCGRYIGGSGRILFLVVIFFLLLMVNAVFAV